MRAKLRLTDITDFGENVSKRVRFACIYDATIPDDQRFQKATPSGTVELYVDNKEALSGMKVGASYYVDFTEVT